jgi:two-component system chemotaxis response regulator CheY
MVVLVVEDSSTMRQLVSYTLRRIPDVVLVEAADGRDALAKLDDIHVDVVVTDLNMPELDGFGLIEEIRKRPAIRATPIIVLTTAGSLPDQARAKELEVYTFVTKPIRGDDLVNAVVNAAQTAR